MDAPGAFQRAPRGFIRGLSFEAALNADPRPTFVLEAVPPGAARGETPSLLFCNDPLTDDAPTLAAIKNATFNASQSSSEDVVEFQLWLSSARALNTSSRAGLRYGDKYWTSYIIDGLIQVVSANECEHSPPYEVQVIAAPEQGGKSSPAQRITGKDTPVPDSNDELKRKSKMVPAHNMQEKQTEIAIDRRYDPKPPPSREDAKVAIPARLSTSMASDWTAENPHGVLSEHETFARNADWSSTPLGSMSSWSAEFREVANLLMRNPHPASLFWGQELTMIYNEPYSKEVAGKKHPGLMGSGFFGPFAELWESVRPIFQECARTGKAIRKENDRLLIERHGYLEETFFSWSWTPLYGGTDSILGFYNAPFETTYQTVSNRRMETLRQLGESTAPARSVSQFWRGALAGLEENPYDIPFATIYSMTDFDSSDTASIPSSSTLSLKLCALEGTIGVPQDHPVAAPKIDFASKDEIAILIRDAVNSREPVALRASDGSLPNMFLDGIDWRGFEIPSNEVLIVPIRSMDEVSTLAILLLGLNPRRRYDDDYKSFIAMLSRQLTTSLASLLRMEDEKRRNRTAAELAALQREQLTQLALQTSRLRRMTEHSPLGMFLFSPDGALLEANDRYYEMTNFPREEIYEMSFLDTVTDASKPTAMEMWRRMTVDHIPQSEEVQLQHNYNTEINEETGKPIDCWILGSCVPEIGLDGQVRSILGSMTDISHMKWAQVLQDQRLREAEDAKRQQNAFIDITSHEMRNPMSAVLICADDIRESLAHHRFRKDEDVKECLEAISTIILCVQHQKSIVDDILTISKLNSNLLVISPIATQPVEVVRQAMKMFKNEAQDKGIDLCLIPHSSLRDLGAGWVMLDPGRLLQIAVNLITNAIKFTQRAPNRFISIHIGASLVAPTPITPEFEYVPTREPQTDVTTSTDWGTGSLLYLRVKVTDTGCGLTLDEKQRLFQRFSQASPRTHAQYGGSGLGLFISRQLAELHGGQIGVASESGRGSTFGFFIQCRNTVDTTTNQPEVSLASQMEASDFRHDVQLLASANGIPVPGLAPISSAFDPKSLYVLVVEDNLVNQKILRRQLEKVGCSVATADNGIVALQYLETTDLYREGTTKLSVILMDLEMPEMDGLTCVKRIRDHEARGIFHRRVPVIAVTANVRVEQLQAARDSGMDDIVSKPFRIPELLARIEAVLGNNIL